uniref:Carbonyl reductase [NADPH] 1-like n=1 Tax=Neolamprologus brichardi TaxID=32507 RepID=A0A3Q4FZU3_NEOBR
MSTKVAVVTGSNKGIGLAVVRALCKQFNGDVYVTSRDVGRGEEAVKTLNSEGLKPKFHQLDINDLNSIKNAAAYFKGKYGGVDILINNAGIAFKASDTTPFGVQAEVTLRTNFFATRDVLTHFLPLVKAGGHVVNVSSMLSASGLKQCSPELQQRFRSEDITEDELVALMQRFVDEAKKGEHKQGGWPDMSYAVSKIGVTVRLNTLSLDFYLTRLQNMLKKMSTVVSTVASQQEGPEFNSTFSLSVWSLHVPPVLAWVLPRWVLPRWVLPRYSGFLPQSKDMHFVGIG